MYTTYHQDPREALQQHFETLSEMEGEAHKDAALRDAAIVTTVGRLHLWRTLCRVLTHVPSHTG